MKKEKGFTLIEILVVVFLLGIIVIIGSNLFFSILKGASKAEIEKEVKQNGDYAISVMERHLRNAVRIESCGATTERLYRCQYTLPPDCDFPFLFEVYENRNSCWTECSRKSGPCPFVCREFQAPSDSFSIVYYNQQNEMNNFTCKDGYIASGSARLTSENVAVENCSFSCDLTKTPPVVNIRFDLSQRGTNLRPEEKAQIHFETTVSLRTY